MLKEDKTDAYGKKPIPDEDKAEQVSIRVSIPMFLRKLPLLPPRLRRVGSRFQPFSMEGKADLSYWLKPWPMMFQPGQCSVPAMTQLEARRG